HLERRAHAVVEPPELVAVEALRRAQRMDARTPQRLVDVDVPHAGERALVEQRRLDRRAPATEALPEACGREQRVERLLAEALREVRVELAGLEQEPRAEPADVAIRNVRSVV